MNEPSEPNAMKCDFLPEEDIEMRIKQHHRRSKRWFLSKMVGQGELRRKHAAVT